MIDLERIEVYFRDPETLPSFLETFLTKYNLMPGVREIKGPAPIPDYECTYGFFVPKMNLILKPNDLDDPSIADPEHNKIMFDAELRSDLLLWMFTVDEKMQDLCGLSDSELICQMNLTEVEYLDFICQLKSINGLRDLKNKEG